MKAFASFAAVLALVASLAANAYFFWVARNAPVIVSPVTEGPVVLRIKGGLLEVSTITAPEQFTATINHTILGVPVGPTVASIRVPAVYRYHVKLESDWRVVLSNKTFVVISPPVTPSLPVAIDTAKLQAQSSGSWSILTGQASIASLQQSITKSLEAKAAMPTYIQLQREAARQTIKEFVAKWLITQEKWKDASAYPIRVFFADEPIQTLSTVPQPFFGWF